MRRLVYNVISLFAFFFIAGCTRTLDEEPVPGGHAVMANLNVSVCLSGVSSSAARAFDDYTIAATDDEKMQTLRIIVVRPDGTVEHNRFLDIEKAAEVYEDASFKVVANESKRIYLFANEGLTTIKNGLPEDVVLPRLPDFDFSALEKGDIFPSDDIAGLTIGLSGSSEELAGPLPMSECHKIWMPAEDRSCRLFIARAAVKFSFMITNESGQPLTLSGLTVDKILRKEYYMPKNTRYTVDEDGIREITEYDVPSSGDNNGYYTFKRTYDDAVTLTSGAEKVLEPVYLLESKYLDPAGNTGQDGTRLNYSMSISLAEYGGTQQKNEYFTNLPQLPRNTHVVVHATIRGKGEINWAVDVEPYGEVILDPIFGLD